MKYLIKKSVSDGPAIYLTNGLSEILEIDTPEEAEAIAEKLRQNNPGVDYTVIPTGHGRGAA